MILIVIACCVKPIPTNYLMPNLERLLYDIDFLAVRDFFVIANVHGKIHQAKTDFDTALEQFIKNPSKESAIILLNQYPYLKDVFEASKPDYH
jgi:hypothetical protein